MPRTFGTFRHYARTGRGLPGASSRCLFLIDDGTVKAALRPQRHVDQANEHGHLDERTDHPGKGLSASDPKDTDADRDGQLEVVARRGEGQGRGAIIGKPEGSPDRKSTR